MAVRAFLEQLISATLYVKTVYPVQIVRKWPSCSGSYTGLSGAIGICFLLLFVLVLPSLAQDPNNNYCENLLGNTPGSFTLSNNQICAGSPVTITRQIAGLTSSNYNYNYSGKGIPVTGNTPQLTFTYSSPGSYTIIQLGVGAGNAIPVIACQVVQVVDVPTVVVGTPTVCSGRTAVVPIQNAGTLPYDGFAIDWQDGTPVDKQSRASVVSQGGQVSHTYLGTFTSFAPTIYGYYNSSSCRSPLVRLPAVQLQTSGNLTPPKPLVSELKTNDDGTITINYQLSGNDPAELQQKDPATGTYQPTGQTGNGGSFTVRTDVKQVQCFKVVAKNSCGIASESDAVCSLVLSVTAVSKQNKLDWQVYTGSAPTFVRYRVYTNGAPSASLNNKGTTTYPDNNIDCGVPYCYYIEATVRGQTETTITSAPVCVTGINTDPAPALKDIFVTIENGAVRLQGTLPPANAPGRYTATISRSDGGNSPFLPVGTVANSLLYIDNTANVNQQSYCYQVSYQTSCGLPSPPTPPVCTVWLNAKTAVGIDWTANAPFSSGGVADYTLETLDTGVNTTTFLDLGGNTHYEPDLTDPKLQTYRYRIIAYDANGTPSYSNYYEVRLEPKLYVPNAFTPNGDGTNDTFAVTGLFVDQFSLTLFSRWGEVVFHSNSPADAWDGRINGQPAPAGEYTYRVEIADQTGKRITRSGPILLIR